MNSIFRRAANFPRYLMEMSQMRNLVKEFHDRLEYGYYFPINHFAFNAEYRKIPGANKTVGALNGRHDRGTKFIKNGLASIFRIKVRNPSGIDNKWQSAGQVIRRSQNGNVIIYDHKNGRVQTFFRNKSALQKEIFGREMCEVIPSPLILRVDFDRHVLVEEMLPFDSQLMLQNRYEKESGIADFYSLYEMHLRKATKSDEDFPSLDIGEIEKNLIHGQDNLNELFGPAHSVGTFKLPMFPSHGDPCLKNFLYADGRLTLIDWEYAGHYSVNYDALHWMFVELFDGNIDYFLGRFMEGIYDEYISELFAIAGVRFDASRRLDYMRAYMVEMLANRPVLNENLDQFNTRYERLCPLIQQYLATAD